MMTREYYEAISQVQGRDIEMRYQSKQEVREMLMLVGWWIVDLNT